MAVCWVSAPEVDDESTSSLADPSDPVSSPRSRGRGVGGLDNSHVRSAAVAYNSGP